MGYLLKEALKTLCGVNQWSYAVFWKIGCQNPKLLIWEECYYEPASCSGLSVNQNQETAFHDYGASWISAETHSLQSYAQAGDRVHSLVNKMMMDNHVNIVGEGLVGRVAFTGNHQWILSENYCKEAHPPEVLKEVNLQFSAGMQTVAVVPVLPHGVVQFGSYLKIMENMAFLNDVTSLVLQLGYVSGVLVPENYAAKEHAAKIGVPMCIGYSAPGVLSLESDVINVPCSYNSFNYVGNSGQNSMVDSQTSFAFDRETQNQLQSNGAAFQHSNSTSSLFRPQHYHQEAKIAQAAKLDFSSSNQWVNGVAKAEVIPSNSEIWMNRHASPYVQRSTLDLPSSSSSTLNSEPKILSGTGTQGHSSSNVSSGILMPTLRMDSGLIYCSNNGSVSRTSGEVSGNGMGSNMEPITGVVSDAKPAGSGNISTEHPASSELKNVNFPKTEASDFDSVEHFTNNSLLGYGSGSKPCLMDNKFAHSELKACKGEREQNTINTTLPQYSEHLNMAELVPGFAEDDRKQKFGGQIHSVNNTKYGDAYVQPESGDDLFDVVGADFKSKLFSSCWNSCLTNESDSKMHNWDKNNLPSTKRLASTDIYLTSQANSDSGIFSSTGTDHLLEAVVLSKAHPSAKQSMDDSVSCRTTLTNTSSSSAPNTSLPYGRFGLSEQMKGELFGVPKYLAKAGAMSSCSLRTGSSKEESGTFSQGSSIYGSQISSWIEKDQKAKQSNSVSTGYSKKPDETSKQNRKRLKPGENPRPRPKDRQMIQDRVKELREIVPNGAKCSIDALLERTIKHMLFLQSVTKHADKLKQTGESKIISKDGGLLLKENFEGGATWAYEVGSQSMVCPIIVEDLNQPRQMLVEMLCEERGLFLEIADIIRGLGLTILKGVMETRNDKIWARFAVEANRDVTRMEIFISLVRLLEQSAKTSAAQPNGISSENMTTQQFHQVASIPVTGSSHSLQ
ncbi:transcription factor LHW isoform X1 [Sesamum indicum]|uniref:Transcription factor LHW isoform X1 n=1 Tax=Sesamum indicum TaxID=4182 RepID=A0A6I9TRD6_SESIN|nr:transcription factor LHW isoform X1 [Sesamum indicum]